MIIYFKSKPLDFLIFNFKIKSEKKKSEVNDSTGLFHKVLQNLSIKKFQFTLRLIKVMSMLTIAPQTQL